MVQIQWKLVTKFFNKFRKPCFWSILGSFSQFSEQDLAMSRTISYVFLAPCQNTTNDTIPRKRPDRRKDARRDGKIETDGRRHRPYFIGPFQLPLGIQKHLWKNDILSKIACQWLATFLKMQLFHRRFSCIFLKELIYLVSP